MERIEINENYKGFDYLVYASARGHRCGYVKIPKGHFLYRKKYSQRLGKFSIKRDLAEEPIGKRGIIDIFCAGSSDHPTMSLLFDVHGGITWSDWGKNLTDIDKVYKNDWLIGFDCIHSGDSRDYEIMDEEHRELNDKYSFSDYGTIRSKRYVQQECKNLIDQIIKYFGVTNET